MPHLRSVLTPTTTHSAPTAPTAPRASELRAVELLDGLCDRMRDYALVSPQGKKTVFWLKVGAGKGRWGAGGNRGAAKYLYR